MISVKEWEETRQRSWQRLGQSGIAATKEELDQIEVADFGLGELRQSGVEMLALVGTEKVAVKLLISFPY